MSLTALPATVDNCIWMIDAGARANAVDPGKPGSVAATVVTRRLPVAAILVTRHPPDHSGHAGRVSMRTWTHNCR